MARKRIFAGGVAVLAIILVAASAAESAPVEVRFGFGGWTLEPLRSTIETRCEKMIRDEFFKILNSVLPSWVLSPVRTIIDSSSSGRSFYAEVWLPLGGGRLAVGLRGDAFDFHIPFTAAASETIQLIGWPVAELSAQGPGTIDLRGFGLTLLGRWKIVDLRKWSLAVRAGVSAFPFRGDLEMDQTLSAATPLGDYQFSGRIAESIADIRAQTDEVPSWIFAPAAGLDLGWRIDSRLSLFANVSLSHGTFYSAGLSASF